MPDRPSDLRIAAFERLPGIQEVVGYGKVRRPHGSSQEATVEIVLGERDPTARFSDQAYVREVGCGQFDLVVVGSQWKDGRRQEPAHGSLTASETVKPSSISTVFGEVDASSRARRGFPSMPIATAPCFKLVVEPKEGRTPSRFDTVVLKLELARALFGVSSRFLLDMLVGLRDPAVAVDAGLFDPAKSSVQPDGTVRIVTHKLLTRREAIMIAAYLTDAPLREFYHSVLRTMLAEPAHLHFQAVYPTPSFPFAEETSWTFDYRWLIRPSPEQPNLTRVVTRITELNFPLSFAAVEVHRPISKVDRSLPPPSSNRTNVTPPNQVRLTTGHAPGLRFAPRVRGESGGEVEMPQAASVRVSEVPLAMMPRPPAPVVVASETGSGDTSTSGRSSGGDPTLRPIGVRRTKTRSRQLTQAEVEASFADVRRQTLAARQLTWKALVVAANQFGADLSDRSHDREPGSSNGFEVEPELLIAEVRKGQRLMIVVDAGAAVGVPRSVGVLTQVEGDHVDRDGLADIRSFAMRHDGHWGRKRNALPGFSIFAGVRLATSGGQASEDEVAAYGARLRRTIELAMAGGRGPAPVL